MTRPPTPDCYDYVRRYYRVPAYIGMRVRLYDSRRDELVEGVLVKATSGHYLSILLDGDTKPRGPYHPTDGIEYLPVSTAPNGTPARSFAVGEPTADAAGDITRA